MLKLVRAAIKPQPRVNFFSANRCARPELLKSSFSFPKLPFRKTYATHRDMGSSWGHRSSSGGSGWWTQFKIPILFTAGVVAFDHVVLGPLFDSNALSTVKRRPELLVYGLMGLNGVVFLLWRVPQLTHVMNRYFLLHKIPQRFNVWGMLGSAFSHQEIWHFGLNMFVLFQFGIPVARWLGTGDFMASYIDSCVLSSLGSLMLPHLLRGAGLMLPSLGASGAIYSILGIFCYLAPHARLSLMFIPLPVGAWWVFMGGLGYNLFQVARRAQTGFDHAGHLAGALTGIAWGYIATEKMKKRRTERQQRLREYENRLFR